MMEAILDKKASTMTGRWTSRLFRLKDRRLMYFKKDVIDFNLAIDSSAKYILDLTYLISLIVDKKRDNVLIIKHPLLDLALRFNSNSLFMSWLKVLSAFTFNIHGNGPSIETALPSNYLYSIWNILQSLYTHPALTSMEGIFRISSNKNERKLMFNQLLQQKYKVQNLKNYADIHILANVLSSLLTNLPSTIFKEKQIENLMRFYDMISNRNDSSNNNINNELFRLNPSQKQKAKHVDHEVEIVSFHILNRLKRKIEELYLTKENERYRYGLMTLIFHLLKQIIINQKYTKMTADSLSRIFVTMLESRIFLIRLKDPMKMFRMHYLIKTLIFHAYFLFPEQEWTVKDIVLAQKCEIALINRYYQCQTRRKQKKKQKRSSKKHHKPYQPNTTKFKSRFKTPDTKDDNPNIKHKRHHKKYQLSKVFSDGDIEQTQDPLIMDDAPGHRHLISKIFSDGDIERSIDGDSDNSDSVSTINSVSHSTDKQKKHSRHKSDGMFQSNLTANNRIRLQTIGDVDEGNYSDGIDEINLNVGRVRADGVFNGRGRSDGVSKMIAIHQQNSKSDKDVYSNRNNKHKRYKTRHKPTVIKRIQEVKNDENVLFNIVLGLDDDVSISSNDIRKDTIYTTPKLGALASTPLEIINHQTECKITVNNDIGKLFMNNSDQLHRYNYNPPTISISDVHIVDDVSLNDDDKKKNNKCVRCISRGCQCATYIFVESSWDKGKCKYCLHPKGAHRDGFDKKFSVLL